MVGTVEDSEDPEVETEAFRKQQTANKEFEANIKKQVAALLGTSHVFNTVDEIKDNAKVIESELMKKREKKRREQGKGPHEILSSSESDEDMYFRGKADLNYSSLEWKDIMHTRLGRQLEDRLNL